MKAAALILIVALGDSTTAGTPYFRSPVEAPPNGSGDPRGSYATWLAQARPRWKVLNRGVNGQRTDQLAARLERDALEAKPRLVVVLGGVNDVYQGTPAEDTRRNLAGIYERVRRAGALPVAASVLPYDRASAEQAAAIRSLNAWIKDEAARRKIPFADLNAAARAPGRPDRLRGSPDGLHPDIDTARLIGEVLARVLDKALRRPRPGARR
jgi:lysophospholipase L1-like esterase